MKHSKAPLDRPLHTVTDLRTKTVETLQEVRDQGGSYILNHSRIEAVLLSVEEYKRMVNRLEELEELEWAQKSLKAVQKEDPADFMDIDEFTEVV